MNKWKREYYRINSIEEYHEVRLNLGIRKKDNPAEFKAQILMYGKCFLKKGIPREQIASKICEKLKGKYRPQKILKIVPEVWKNSTQVNNRLGKTMKKNGKNTNEIYPQEIEKLKAEIQNKEQEIQNLESENQALKNENEYLTNYIKKTFRDNGM